MKKTQLKRIIRESIREILNEDRTSRPCPPGTSGVWPNCHINPIDPIKGADGKVMGPHTPSDGPGPYYPDKPWGNDSAIQSGCSSDAECQSSSEPHGCCEGGVCTSCDEGELLDFLNRATQCETDFDCGGNEVCYHHPTGRCVPNWTNSGIPILMNNPPATRSMAREGMNESSLLLEFPWGAFIRVLSFPKGIRKDPEEIQWA